MVYINMLIKIMFLMTFKYIFLSFEEEENS